MQVTYLTVPTKSAAVPTSHCIDARGSLCVPGGLAHLHIHLDKAYLLDRCTLSTGTFDEALTSTAAAKSKFDEADVFGRGQRLIASSISHGVTTMRAFVEVDPTVGLVCLRAGLALKEEYKGRCNVQIVAFAQDPLFYPDDPGKEEEMMRLMREAAAMKGMHVLGSAPYVESPGKQADKMSEKDKRKAQKSLQRRNVDWIFELAKDFGLHVDFHLDYDLNPPGKEEDGEESMIPYVLKRASASTWKHAQTKRERGVTMGHCTKLSTFTDSDLSHLASLIPAPSSPESAPVVSFISLPPSDLYMQGRDAPYATRSRATLPLLSLASHPSLSSKVNLAVGVNNVANLFTPQGDADPLALLPLLVGVWQSAKPQDCETLLAAISSTARIAMGLLPFDDQAWADLTLLDGSTSVQSAVCSPPFSRITIKNGTIVSVRKVDSQVYLG